jgi:hypothetical protein
MVISDLRRCLLQGLRHFSVESFLNWRSKILEGPWNDEEAEFFSI